MVSFTPTDRSTICILEENIRAALEEFINVDPSDRWMVEDLISRFARKETITKDDETLGYVLVSAPEKTVEVSMKDGYSGQIAELKEIVEKNNFKFVT